MIILALDSQYGGRGAMHALTGPHSVCRTWRRKLSWGAGQCSACQRACSRSWPRFQGPLALQRRRGRSCSCSGTGARLTTWRCALLRSTTVPYAGLTCWIPQPIKRSVFRAPPLWACALLRSTHTTTIVVVLDTSNNPAALRLRQHWTHVSTMASLVFAMYRKAKHCLQHRTLWN